MFSDLQTFSNQAGVKTNATHVLHVSETKEIFQQTKHTLVFLYYSPFLMLFQSTQLILYPLINNNLQFEKHYYCLYDHITYHLKTILHFSDYIQNRRKFPSLPGNTLDATLSEPH